MASVFSISPASVVSAEGNSGSTAFQFTVTRSGDVSSAVSVAFNTVGTGSSPASASDFSGSAFPQGLLSFAAQETSKVITIPIAGDQSVESDETFQVVLSDPSGGNSGPGYYLAESGQLRVQFEDLGTNPPSKWTFQNSGDASGNQTSFQGDGYYVWGTPGNEVLNTPDGLLTYTIFVPEGEGGIYTMRISASRDPGGRFDQQNDLWVRVDGNSEANMPAGTVDIVSNSGFVKLFGVGTTNFAYAQNLDSVHETDPNPLARFVLSEGFHEITFAGRSEGYHVDFFELYNGAAPTSDSPFIGENGGVTFADDRADGEIVNDDAAPTGSVFAVSPASQNTVETDSGTNTVNVTISRTGDINSSASVNWSVQGSGANPATASDFSGNALPSGLAMFAAGQASVVVPIPVQGDTQPEANETFAVVLANPSSGSSVSGDPAVVTIVNDDASDPSDPSAVTAYLASVGPGLAPLELVDGMVIEYAQVDGLNLGLYAESDPAAGFSSAVLTLDGTTSRTENVAPWALFGDANGQLLGGTMLDPGVHNLNIAFYSQANGGGSLLEVRNYEFTIEDEPVTDPDPEPQTGEFAVVGTQATVTEGDAGSTAVTFDVNWSGDFASSVSWSVAGSGANPADSADFNSATSGQLQFAAGQTSQSVTVQVAGDTMVEPDEQFSVVLSNPGANASISGAPATTTILNDDAASPPPVDPPPSTSGDLTFYLVDTNTDEVLYELSDGTAIPASVAGASVSIVAAVADGLGAESASISAFGETRVENVAPYALFGDVNGDYNSGNFSLVNGESYEVSASAYSGNGASGSLVASDSIVFQVGGTTPADPLGLSVSPASQNLSEGDSQNPTFSYTVSTTGGDGSATSINWAVSPVGANPVDPADFVGGLPSGTLNLPAGVQSGQVTFDVMSDTTVEPDETFEVSFSVAGQAGATVVASGQVLNDDASEPDPGPSGDVSVYLVDTQTDTIIQELTPGSQVSSSLLSETVSIYAVADASLDAESAVLLLDNSASRTENVEPYALFGDSNGDFFGGVNLLPGDHNFSISLYSADGGSGQLLRAENYSFTVVSDDVVL